MSSSVLRADQPAGTLGNELAPSRASRSGPDPGAAAARPTISAVIPAYNSSRTLGEALESVRGQTHAVHEIIVVDDGSTREEAEAIDRVAAGCTVIHLPKNRGPSVARNKGVARAIGEWVAFLDSDDLWLPRKLEQQVAHIKAHPCCRAVHCSMRGIGRDGQETVNIKTEVTFEDLVEFPCPVFPSAVMMHRETLIEAGLFDPTKRCCEDLDLFLRFTSEHSIECVAEPLVVRRASWDGLSSNIPRFWREADRVYREYQHVFQDEARARETLIGLHSDFVLRALYKRDFSVAWKMGRRAVRHDVPLLRVLPSVVASFVRNRMRRRRRPESRAHAPQMRRRGPFLSGDAALSPGGGRYGGPW
jgi:glycosyltransferase involved in cell wall biosynthesis